MRILTNIYMCPWTLICILTLLRGHLGKIGDFKKFYTLYKQRDTLYTLVSTSTSTLILPRASASRASDVINMVKSSVFTVKNVVVLSRMCDSADEQRTHLQMPHALGLVVGRSIL